MGAECSAERKEKSKDRLKKPEEEIESNIMDLSQSKSFFDCKNYKEYTVKMEILKEKIKEITYRIENRTEFSMNKE
jgi:hypothetical protein